MAVVNVNKLQAQYNIGLHCEISIRLAVSKSSGWPGILPFSNGGTGAANCANHVFSNGGILPFF